MPSSFDSAIPSSSAAPTKPVDASGGSSDFVSRHAADVARAFDGLELGPDVREKCREWVEGSLRRLHDDAAANAPTGAVDRSLDEVLGVASRALKHVLSSHIGGASGVDDLQSLFKAVEITSSFASDDHSVESVVEVVREAADEVLRKIALEREARFEIQAAAADDHEWSLEELRARWAALPASGLTLNAPSDPLDRAPILAIALQLTLGMEALSPRMWGHAQLLLRGCASDDARRVLPSLLRDLCEPGRRNRAELALKLLTTTFAGDEERIWLEPALAVCESADLEVLDVFWPALVDRFVSGGPWKDGALRERTIAQIGRLPRTRVFAVSRRLQLQPGLAAGKLAPSAFEVYDERLSPLYLALVSVRSTNVYGDALLAMVRRRASSWPGALAFRLMESFGASARALLSSLFSHGTLDEPASDTRVMAVRALAQRLMELSQEARNASWIVPAIEALGDAACDEGRAALARVLEERRWLVAPAWSSEQRRAAQSVRARLDAAGAAPAAQEATE